MIREFIYKYYIDPIRYGQPYTLIDTLTYALLLIIAVYLVYRWLHRSGIRFDGPLLLATLPFVVFGGLLRVVQDTGIIASDLQYLLVTPIIFFVVFAVTAIVLVAARYASGGRQDRFLRLYAGAGVAACLLAGGVLVWYGLTSSRLDGLVLVSILALAAVSSLLVYGFVRYVLRWEYAADPLYVSLIAGHMLDASATSYGIDLHPLKYVEQHVVGSTLIDWTGTAFSMFPLKLAVVVPGIYVLNAYRKEANPELWHLVVLAMIVVGLAPGVRDLARMILYV